MSTIEARAAAMGAAARAKTTARLAERLRSELPDRAVRVADGSNVDNVVVSGRGVLSDPRLAWVGSLVR